MITDDVQIDRRILQEGETLSSEGHEIILLAASKDGSTSFETIGNIKVERINPFAVVSSVPVRSQIKRWLITDWRAWPLLPLLAVALVLRIVGKALASLLRALYRMIVAIAREVTAVISQLAAQTRAAYQKGIAWAMNRGERAVTWYWAKCTAQTGDLAGHELAILERLRFYRPDLIHAHDLPQLRVAVAGKRILNVPLIYDSHELYPEICTLTPDEKRYLFDREAQLVHHCDHIIIINHLTAAEMAHRYKISPPSVIMNAVNCPENFDPATKPDRYRKILPIPEDHWILLYQGWFSPFRGLQTLVSSFSGIREDIHLILMGYGDFCHDLEAIARERGLLDRVHIIDAVPQSELLYWTASADAGIICYPAVDLGHYFCSPNKLFEFIQAELPIVANDLPFLQHVVGREGFGVIRKLDTEDDLAQAIEEMFDPALGGPDRFRPRLRERKKEYSWEAEAPKLLEIYRQVMERNSSGQSKQ